MLKDKVALVTGGTRGIGNGIVRSLAAKGATVYFTGRTVQEFQGVVPLPGSLCKTEEAVRQAGGAAYGIACDHVDDVQTKAAVDRVLSEQGKIDILVNNVWGGYEHYSDGTPFWQEKGFWDAPISRFDKMMIAGVRAHYVTSRFVVPSMIAAGNGLIFNISFWAAEQEDKGVCYGMAKAATNKMTRTMAHELRDSNIGVVTIYPGLVRTESVLMYEHYFDMSNSESPEFIGLAIAALAGDDAIMGKTGSVQIAAQVALDYGFADIDGRQPIPLTHG